MERNGERAEAGEGRRTTDAVSSEERPDELIVLPPEGRLPDDVSYVTACALGLAFSEHRDESAVGMLVNAGGSCPELLRAAHRAIDTVPIGDASTRAAASDLLVRALELAGTRSTGSPPDA